MSNKPISRITALANIWMKHGCPEKMTIHVKSTGETITLIDGLPVTLTAENNPVLMPTSKAQNRELMVRQPVTLTRTCERCKTQFKVERKRAKYCSPRCRMQAKRDREAQASIAEYERLLTAS